MSFIKDGDASIHYDGDDVKVVGGSAEITCKVPDGIEAGAYNVRVVSQSGDESLSDAKFTVLTEITLQKNEGSLAGGSLLEIHSSAASFPLAKSDNEIKVGEMPCDILEVSKTVIKCTVPDALGIVTVNSSFTTTSLSLPVEVTSNSVAATCSGGCDYTYSGGSTALVQEAYLAFNDLSQDYNLTLVGENIVEVEEVANLAISVTPFSGSGGTVYIVSGRGMLGDGRDFVNYRISSSTVAGKYIVTMRNHKGLAAWDSPNLDKSFNTSDFKSIMITVEPKIFSTEQAEKESLEGGNLVSITGTGFPNCTESAGILDFEGDHSHLSVNLLSDGGKTLDCRILQSTSTSISCLVAPAMNLNGGGDLTLSSLRVNVAGYGSYLTAVSTPFTLQLLQLLTPKVISLSPTTTQSYSSSQIPLTLKCENCSHLADIVGRWMYVHVHLLNAEGNASFDDLSFDNATQELTFKPANNLVAGTYGVQIVSRQAGDSNVAPQTLEVPLIIDRVNSTVGGFGGGQVIRIEGKGFGSSNYVKIGERECVQVYSDSAFVTVHSVIECKIAAVSDTHAVSEDPLTIFVKTSKMPDWQDSGFQYTFMETLTPEILSVFPSSGSSEGGTLLTITGKRFNQLKDAHLSISIGDAGQCVNTTITVNIGAEFITCTTTALKDKSDIMISKQLVVYAQNVGYAIGNVNYTYADLWSRTTTWGGGPSPAAGESVVIPKGQSLLLDVSTPWLNLVVIEGELRFAENENADAMIELKAKYIFLNRGGKLRIGSESRPYNGKAVITMSGDMNSKELPVYGAKVIGLREGSIEIHGKPKSPVWTRLSATANVDDSAIEIDGDVNWEVKDKIVIAPSSFKQEEAEEAIIKSIEKQSTKTIITLESPLNFTHLGVVADFDGETIDMRAEVAILSRNVVIRGDSEFTKKQRYGPHILVHDHRTGHCLKGNVDECGVSESYLRMENVEMMNCGQGSRLGRYCIHFHMHGDASKSYLRGNSVHHSFHRAVAVHGTHRLLIDNNVAYDIEGHAYFVEDGIEMENVFKDNIGLLVKKAHSSLNTDTTPAVFWITNPHNTFVGNVAAGSAAYGFWFDLPDSPTGASSMVSETCSKYLPLIQFENNTAHSSDKYGLRIFEEMIPLRKDIHCKKEVWKSRYTPARFKHSTFYKNGVKGAIATKVANVWFEHFKVADNGAGPNQHKVNGKDHGGGIEMTWLLEYRNGLKTPVADMPGVKNALIVARSSQGQVGTAAYWPSNRGIKGLITQTPNHISSRAFLGVSNVTFWNFNGGQFYALEACGKCKKGQGASTTFFEGIKFKGLKEGEKPALAKWTWSFQGIFADTDGSLIGKSFCKNKNSDCTGAGGTIVADSGLLRDSECFEDSTILNVGGKICNPGISHRRIMVNNVKPNSVKVYDLMVSEEAAECPTNDFGYNVCKAEVPFSKYNWNGHSFHVVSGRNYTLETGSPMRADFQKFRIFGFDNQLEENHVILQHRYLQGQDHIRVNNKKRASSSVDLVSGNTHGAISYNGSVHEFNPFQNNTDTVLSIFVHGEKDNTLNIDARACPDSGCDADIPGAGSMEGSFV